MRSLGPSSDPCGTPQVTGLVCEELLPVFQIADHPLQQISTESHSGLGVCKLEFLGCCVECFLEVNVDNTNYFSVVKNCFPGFVQVN